MKYRGRVVQVAISFAGESRFHCVRELLQRVKDDGKQIALASSAKEDEIEVYKRIAHIEDLVEEQRHPDDAER